MLHLETVESDTFSVLKQLMEMPELQDFSLVGGTALSLLYGHRMSVDLDMFSNKHFDNTNIINALKKEFGNSFIMEEKPPRFGIFCFVNEVKIDIVRFPHPLIRPKITIDGIRMFSTEDIIAMKVQAILGRGKKKDFWDIAELLKHFPISDFIKFHKEK
jgi:predicted nucleotidyltransferase component of viral defense system